eukprot:m.158284 g.158284  ORF g.158284 m.158284 type:complete len:971 (+) comp17016_c0_seq1:203-3115(+)
MSQQIRRFAFFDKELVRADALLVMLQTLNIQAATSGHQKLVFGDAGGVIHFLERNLQNYGFQAYAFSLTHLYQLRFSNILVSVGSDEEGITPCVKVWNLDKTDRNGAPQIVRSFKVLYGSKPVPVSQICVHEDLNYIAVGLTNGNVLLYKGDLAHDRFSNKPGKLLFECGAPVTGLAFRQDGAETVLFVATTTSVMSFFLGGARERREELDHFGCELGCAVQSEVDGTFFVGRTECLYGYEPEARGAALGLEGEKVKLAWFRNYLIVVHREGKRPDSIDNSKVTTHVTIYDVRNKFIVYAQAFNDVLFVLSEWGTVFVLCGDGKMYQLVEKDFQSKLDGLFKKQLYDIAINLAKSQYSGKEGSDFLIDIYTAYAEHLYRKSNYDAAIQQYIKTIGKLEPSYVIRKFLDSQRIYNLTDYLQALHERELADKHHTTLLLNCYTKLKRVDKLDEFIMTDKNLNFDFATAIQVCRQASYFKHALYLAAKVEQHDLYLKIQLEDLKDYHQALNYITRLPFHQIEENLQKYGKDLVNEMPDMTTQLLMDLCSGRLGRNDSEKAKAEEYIHIFVNQLPSLTKFLEHIVQTQPDSPQQVYDTLLELYLRSENIDHADPKAIKMREQWILDLLKRSTTKYDEYHAMVLMQIYDFTPGILYLYEQAKQYHQIVQYYMEKNAYAGIIETCKKHGSADRSLWVSALTYFAGKEEDSRAQISEVLAHIDKHNLLPPLMVIDALSHNSNATLSVIKDYITRRLESENQSIQEDERSIRTFQEQTQKMRADIKDLKTQAKIFQEMKCTNCKNSLELPAVHFLCGHSYHQSCLVGDVDECTYCAPERKKVEDIVQSQMQTAEQHDLFFKQLETSSNRFSVVADYFGRGVFAKSLARIPAASRRSQAAVSPNLGGSGGAPGSGVRAAPNANRQSMDMPPMLDLTSALGPIDLGVLDRPGPGIGGGMGGGRGRSGGRGGGGGGGFINS